MLISHTVCHQGLVREQNEDSYFSNADEGLWVIADGVGGNVGGHIASQLSVQTVERKLRQGSSLSSAIMSANQLVISTALQQPELKGMATTIVAVKFLDNCYELAWVGDSRAYLIDSEQLCLLSSDHNVANELYVDGQITLQELQSHPGQHELTQALGQADLMGASLKSGCLSHGSIMLLCSDGLSGVLSDELIYELIKHESSLESASQVLLKYVLKAGAPDNVSISLIQYVNQNLETSEKAVLNDNKTKNKRKSKNKASLTWGILVVVTLIMVFLLFLG